MDSPAPVPENISRVAYRPATDGPKRAPRFLWTEACPLPITMLSPREAILAHAIAQPVHRQD